MRRAAKTDANQQTLKATVTWPKPILSPNSREHWARKGRAVKAYREEAYLSAIADGLRPMNGVTGCDVRITFTPPDRRPRDRDNMISSFKAGQDGIADAIGIDDALWRPSYAVSEPKSPGSVTVEFLSFDIPMKGSVE